MAVIKDKYIIEVDPGTQQLRGAGALVDKLAGQLEGLATRAKGAQTSLSLKDVDFRTVKAAADSISNLNKVVRDLRANSGQIDVGKVTLNTAEALNKLSDFKAKTLKISQELAGSMVDAARKPGGGGLASMLGSLGYGPRTINSLTQPGVPLDKILGKVTGTLWGRDYGAQFSTARNSLDAVINKGVANSGGTSQYAAAASQAETLSASYAKVMAKSQAMQQAVEALRQSLGSSAVSAETYNKALRAISTSLEGTNFDIKERVALSKAVVDALHRERVAEEEASQASKVASAEKAIRLKALLARQLSRSVTTGTITDGQAQDVAKSVNKGIDAGTLTTARAVQSAQAAASAKVLGDQRQGLLLQESMIRAKAMETSKQGQLRDLTRQILTDEKLLRDLRGASLSVIEEIAAEMKDVDVQTLRTSASFRDLVRAKAQNQISANNNSGKGLNDFGVAFATGFASQQMIGGITAGVNKVSEFEDSLIKVRRTANASTETMWALGEAILDMGQKVPVSAKEMAEAAAALGQIGVLDFNDEKLTQGSVKIQDAAKAVKLIAETSLVAELSTTDAATAYGQFSIVFSDSVERIKKGLAEVGIQSATTADAMKVVFGSINEVGNQTAATTEDLMAFTRQFGGMASTIGISAEKVIALGGVLADMQVRSEVAGTAMTRLFARATESADAFGKVMNISGAEFRGRFSVDAMGTMVDFLTTLGQKAKEDKLAITDFASAVNMETRERNVFSKLVESSNLLNQGLAKGSDLLKNYTSVEQEAAKKSEAFSAQVTKLNNAFLQLLVQGKPLYDMLGKIVGALANVVSGIANMGGTGTMVVLGGITALLGTAVLLAVSLWAKFKLAVEALRATLPVLDQMRTKMAQLQATAVPAGGVLSRVLLGAAGAAGVIATVAALWPSVSKEAQEGGEKAGTAMVDGIAMALAVGLPSVLTIVSAFAGQVTAILKTAATFLFTTPWGLALVAATAATGYAVSALHDEAQRLDNEAERVNKLLAAARQGGKAQAADPTVKQEDMNTALSTAVGLYDANTTAIVGLVQATKEWAKALKEADLVPQTKTLATLLRDMSSATEFTKEYGKDLRATKAQIAEMTQGFENQAASWVKGYNSAADAARMLTGVNSGVFDHASDAKDGFTRSKDSTKTLENYRREQTSIRLAAEKELIEAWRIGEENSGVFGDSVLKEYADNTAKRAQKELAQASSNIAAADKLLPALSAAPLIPLSAAAKEFKGFVGLANEEYAKAPAKAERTAKTIRDKVNAALRGNKSDHFSAGIEDLDKRRASLLGVEDLLDGRELQEQLGPALVKNLRDTLAAAREQLSTESGEFVRETYNTALKKSIDDALAEARRNVAAIIASIEDEKNKQEAEFEKAQHQLSRQLDDRETANSNIIAQANSLKAIATTLRSFSDLTDSNLTGPLKDAADYAKQAGDAVSTFADHVQNARENLARLGEQGGKAMEAVTRSIEGATEALKANIKQTAFNKSKQIGQESVNERKNLDEASGYLARTSSAQDVQRQIKEVLGSTKLDDTQKAAEVGRIEQTYRNKLEKTGGIESRGAVEFLAQLDKEMGQFYSAHKGDTPEQAAANAVREIGTTTNTLLKDISDYLQNLSGKGPSATLGDRGWGDPFNTSALTASRTPAQDFTSQANRDLARASDESRSIAEAKRQQAQAQREREDANREWSNQKSRVDTALKDLSLIKNKTERGTVTDADLARWKEQMTQLRDQFPALLKDLKDPDLTSIQSMSKYSQDVTSAVTSQKSEMDKLNLAKTSGMKPDVYTKRLDEISKITEGMSITVSKVVDVTFDLSEKLKTVGSSFNEMASANGNLAKSATGLSTVITTATTAARAASDAINDAKNAGGR